MIVLDTSAIMAVLLNEIGADQIAEVLEAEDSVVMSAGTLAETRIVAVRHGMAKRLEQLLEVLGVEVETLSEADTIAVSEAYARWGKGIHPARLNFGDCFAYATAMRKNAPLLFVGRDFSKTDVTPVL